MNGELLCVDTNIIIFTLAGSQSLADRVRGRMLAVSVVAEIEALSYPGLTVRERVRISEYVSRCVVIDIGDRVKMEAIALRAAFKLKLPDAIIAATALVLDATLLTADKDMLRVAQNVKVQLVTP
jgi:predicted nucleic acid-binding protein